jgi:hypothetical protein
MVAITASHPRPEKQNRSIYILMDCFSLSIFLTHSQVALAAAAVSSAAPAVVAAEVS